MPATTLEEFVVTLGATVDEGSLRRMQAGLQQVGQAVQQVQVALAEVQRAMGGVAQSFTAIAGAPSQNLQESARKQKNTIDELKKGVVEWGRSLTLTIGAFMGGMKAVANQYEQLGYAAQRAGTSAQNLLVMGEAMSRLGGQAEDVTGAMQRMAATFRESPGEEQHALAIAGKYFDEIERKVPGADQRTKEYLGILTEMKRYHEQNQDFMANALGREFFGWDDARSQQAINTYDTYIQRLNETKKRLDDLGLTQDRMAQITKQSAEFNNDLRDILLELRAAWMKAFSEVEPILHPILQVLAGILHVMNKLPFGSLAMSIIAAVGAARLLMAVAGGAGGGGLLGILGAIAGQFGVIGKIVGLIITNLPTLLGLIGKLPSLIGLITGGLEALGVALGIGTGGAALLVAGLVLGAYEIIKHWDAVKKFFSALWAHLSGIFGPLLEVMTAPFRLAKDVIVGIWDLITGNISGAVERFRAVFQTLEDVLTAPFRAALAIAEKLIAAWRWITGQKAPEPTTIEHAPQEQARQRAPLALPPPAAQQAMARYQRGGIVNIAAHEGEMVLPKNISEGLQRLYSRAQPAAEDIGRTFSKALAPVKEAIDGLEKKLPSKEELTTALGGGVKRLTDWVGAGSQVLVKNVKDFGNQFKTAFNQAVTGQPGAPGAAPGAPGAAPAEAAGPSGAAPAAPSVTQLPGGRAEPGGIPGLQMAPPMAIGALRPGAPSTAVGGAVAQPTAQAWAAPPAPGAAGAPTGAPGAAGAPAGAAPTTFGGRVGAAVGGAAGAVARAVSGARGEVIAAAQASEAKWGIPASVTMAQYQLESGGGRHMPPGSNNPFGIKAKPGEPYVESSTQEFEGGRMVTKTQRFRKYDSLTEAFDEHGKLLATAPAYAEARKYKDDPGKFAEALTGVYATDPTYGKQLKNIMASQARMPTAIPGETPKGGGRIPYPVIGETGEGGGKVLTTSPPAGVDPDLFAATAAGFAASLPEGYTAKVSSGFRKGDPRYHGKGMALDWQIFDKDGKPVPNRGADSSGLYGKAYVHSMANMMVANPDKAKEMGWGGHFVIPGTNTPDIMHYDLGGPRGQLASAKQVAAERQQATQIAQAMQAGPPVMQAQRGGLIPTNIMGGIQPLLAHAGEMVLPQALSQGLQSLIGAVGNMTGGGMLNAIGNMGSARLGGDTVHHYYGGNNVNVTQTNTTHLDGGQPSSLAKYRDVHERIYGDLVRNFRTAMI